jgi:putative glutamine amidotransferase
LNDFNSGAPVPTGRRGATETSAEPAPPSGDEYRPIIGLTTYRAQAQTGVWDVQASFLPAVYFDAVTAAGGIAVLLPPQPATAAIAERVLDGLDGLIITGGPDIEPARYGAEAHPTTDKPHHMRDAWEEALLTAAIARNLPFLGICRGLEVLNVATGGTLHQHLPEVVGSDRYRVGGGEFAVNEAITTGDGVLSTLLAETPSLPVKSYHHQAIDELGRGLIVTARTDDGLPYAVEYSDVDFGVAVQWHPEEDAADDIRLFAGLVDAARAHKEVAV